MSDAGPGHIISNSARPEPDSSLPQWLLRRKLVLDVTRYLMWGLPVIIILDLIFDTELVQILGVPALSGIIGLPSGYLIGRSVQTAIRERQSVRITE